MQPDPFIFTFYPGHVGKKLLPAPLPVGKQRTQPNLTFPGYVIDISDSANR